MDFTMFEKLQQLPLFQGLSVEELSSVVAHTKLEFAQYSKGDTIVSQDEICNKLIYVLDGQYTSQYVDAAYRFSFVEEMGAPGVIEAQNLFGRFQRYKKTYMFNTDGSTVAITRQTVIDFLTDYRIIKLNLLNMLSSKLQHYESFIRECEPAHPIQKIVRFIKSNSELRTGSKHLYVKMEDLANIVNEPRLNVSRALKVMEQAGLITLKRGEIHVADIYELVRHRFELD